MKKKKIIKFLLFIILSVYVIITLLNQQIIINRYNENQDKLAKQIEEQKDHNKELVATKGNVDSTEFIEQMAREKLDMYLPTERVYIDTGM